MTGRDALTEKDAYQVVKFSRKHKDYYCWCWIFLSHAEIRKYQDVLTRKKPIPDMEDAAVKAEMTLGLRLVIWKYLLDCRKLNWSC